MPDIRFLLSINNENAWSDLLATLIDADPFTSRLVLGLPADQALTVRREVTKSRAGGKKERPDIVISIDDRTVAIIEVKLLAVLGEDQLGRYFRSVEPEHRHDCRFFAVSLQRLRIDTTHAAEWTNLTWEETVRPFAGSPEPWVAATAEAWLAHIESNVPVVDSDTVWNDITGDVFLGLRVRSSYIYDQLEAPGSMKKQLVSAASGGKYVVLFDAKIPESDYSIRWEMEEDLPVQQLGKLDDPSKINGPSVHFSLVQHVPITRTSRGYDWEHLSRLWNDYLVDSDIAWFGVGPNPRAEWDKAGVALIRTMGAPKILGVGYGDKQAQISGECLFGARFRMSPTSTLGQIASRLQDVADIGARMAQHPILPRTLPT